VTRLLILVTAMLIAACIGGAVIATAATSSIVEKRQETMKSMAAAAKTIGDMFQGKLSYDVNAFKAAAQLISARSGRALLDDFPPTSIGGRSQADAKIWAQWDEFQILAGRLSVLGAALALDADKSPDTIGSDMRMQPGAMMGGSLLGGPPKALTEADIENLPAEHAYHLMLEACTSCHAKFRTKRD
jgi:cytochrome c556